MQYLILLFSGLFLSTAAIAQKTRTIYYPSGKKALEGQWTLEAGYHAIDNVGDWFLNNNKNELSHVYLTFQDLQGQVQGFAAAGVRLRYNGQLRGWYHNGERKFEVTYNNGVLDGPAAFFQTNGQPYLRGAFSNGMLTGTWTSYNLYGRIESTGSYKPLTQEELEEVVLNGITNARQIQSIAESRKLQCLPYKEYETPGISETVMKFEGAFPYHNMFPYGRADGLFQLYDTSGRVYARYHFKDGKRNGIWEILEPYSTTYPFRMQYENGRMIATSLRDEPLQPIVQIAAEGKKPLSRLSQPKGTRSPTAEQLSSPSHIHAVVDQVPEYNSDVRVFIQQNVRYPEAAKKAGIEGRVVVQFIVNADGLTENATVTRGIGYGCDEEALRLVRSMSRWRPAKVNGKPVRSYFSLPIKFALNGEK